MTEIKNNEISDENSASENAFKNEGDIHSQDINSSNSDHSPDSEEPTGEESGASVFFTFEAAEDESEIPKKTGILKIFLELREIDEELTDIEEEKGDLPSEIRTIKSKVERLSGSLSAEKERFTNLTDEKNSLEDENSSYEEKINKYDEQKFNVRSNTEYDEITKAIESLFVIVEKNEKKIKEIIKEIEGLNIDSHSRETDLTELSGELSEKEKQLNELNEQFLQDESALLEKRNDLISKLAPEFVTLYEKINGSYNGEATAIVRNGNCSGCYNSIPPQRVIEIKTAENIYTCQSCGRILISEELQSNG